MTTTASAPAKAILLGEHSALYGKSVLTMALDKRSRSVVSKRRDDKIVVNAPDFDISARVLTDDDHEPALALVARSVELASEGPGGFDITISSEIPIASGLGSSASIPASLIAAIAAEAGRDLSKQELAELTWEAENVIHTKSSGVDPFAVVFGGLCLYREGSVKHIDAEPPRLVIGHTGIVSDTGKVVAAVDERKKRHPEAFSAFLDDAEALVLDGKEALLGGDWARLGKLMDKNHELLSGIGISCPELDKAVAAARAAGAFGAKLCGAGCGGIMIALVDEKSKTAVEKALLDSGVKLIDVHPDKEGVMLE